MHLHSKLSFATALALILILSGCSSKTKQSYKAIILDIHSLNIKVPDQVGMSNSDVIIMNKIIQNIATKTFINKSGKKVYMTLTVMEFKNPADGWLPYFVKFEFSHRGQSENLVITGAYDLQNLDIRNPEDSKTIIEDLAQYISDKVISYLNQISGFNASDTFEDAFISYNYSMQNQQHYYGRPNNVNDSGIFVTWNNQTSSY